MQISKILKRGKLERYYKVNSLDRGCVAYVDTIFFDAKYCDLLLSEELQAIGAHEFTHLNNGHASKRFMRTIFPTLVVGLAILGIFLTNSEQINTIPFFSSLVGSIIILFVPLLTLISVLISSFFIKAKWFRQQETECDLSAIKFTNGEALISALIKLNKIRSKKKKRSDSRFTLRLYPSFEQRINDIRAAMKKTVLN